MNLIQNADFDKLNTYKKTRLENGVRIITEEVPYFQSVSLGIWVRTGSRFELPEVNGICHFIEHMLFKGTQKRDALTIAKEIDSVGGVLNAFTSKEMTSFYCRVLSENLNVATELLGDIFLNPSFPEDEIEREKLVICSEIHQLEDSPEDLVHEILGIRFWHNDPLGQPILGTIPNVSGLSRETISKFKSDHYTPEDTIICAAGKLNHDEFVDLFRDGMNSLLPHDPITKCNGVRTNPCAEVISRDLEQVHFCVGMPSPGAVDASRHAAYILNTILGGGMSSRLFQEVREKRGLAYSVYSYSSSFSDTGIFGLYAGCEPDRFEELLEVMGNETLGIVHTITEEELLTAKNQIRGNVILAMESTDSRMNRLAKSEFYFGRYVGMNEILDAVDAVTLDELTGVAETILDPAKFTMIALGPVDSDTNILQYFQS